MPAPLLLQRPGGRLVVRFWVPLDLRPLVGRAWLVRSLGRMRPALAHFVAGRMGLALALAFDSIRGQRMDPKLLAEVLDKARRGELRDWSASSVKLPNGVQLEGIKVDTPEDAKAFSETLGQLAALAPPSPGPVREVDEARAAALDKAWMRYTEAAETYVADMERAKRAAKNVLDTRFSLGLFGALANLDSAMLAEVNAGHVRTFLDALEVYPANASKLPEFAGLTPPEILKRVKAAPDRWPRLGPRTKGKHRDRLATFFNAMVGQGLLERSPLTAIPRAARVKGSASARRPFTDAELSAMFEPAGWTAFASKYAHRWFGVALLYGTGARVNEVAQLYLEDFETIGDVMGFHVRERREDQSTKTDGSGRFLPVPSWLRPSLVRYLDEVRAAGLSRIFPTLTWTAAAGYGDALSDQARRYFKSLGITDRTMGVHAFRHTLASRLSHAGIPQATIASITGHAQAGPGSLGAYVSPAQVKQLLDALDAFGPPVPVREYPGGLWAKDLKALAASEARKKRG